MSSPHRSALLGLVALCLLAPPGASAQQAEQPPLYTFVAQWTVPRAQWGEAAAFFEKTTRPVLERLTASGTLAGWGNTDTVVHQEDATTHGTWWTASSLAGIERAREELLKLPPNPAMASAKHRDYLLRSIIYNGKPAGPASGYLSVGSTKVQPGKGQQWREFWEKYTKPTYDELVADGTIAGYSVDVEQVHTDDPGWRFVVFVAPSADAVDKVNAAFQALFRKRGPEENRGIFATQAELTVAGVHRDSFARVPAYARK